MTLISQMLTIIAIGALVFVGLFIWKRLAFLAAAAAGMFILLGFQALTLSDSSNPTNITDPWMGLFWLSEFLAVAMILLPAVMREKPAEQKGDLYMEDIDGSDLSSLFPQGPPKSNIMSKEEAEYRRKLRRLKRAARTGRIEE